MVNNVSQEDWTDVSLTLATGAPMSFVAWTCTRRST